MDDKLFANTSVNPSNAGFCIPPGNCLVSGLLNLEACAQSKSVFSAVNCTQEKKSLCNHFIKPFVNNDPKNKIQKVTQNGPLKFLYHSLVLFTSTIQ